MLTHAVEANTPEWILTYRVSEEQMIEAQKDTGPKSETRTYTQIVTMAADYLVVQDDRQKLIRDFARHRFISLDLTKNTYDDWPLFALVDFFASELTNRNVLGGALRAGGVKDAAFQFDRYDNEAVLRVESTNAKPDDPKPVITSLRSNGRIEFQHRGKTVVHFRPSDIALPTDLQRRFANYLAHTHAIHPEIRRAILAEKIIPDELGYTSRNLNRVTTVTLHLVSAQPGTGASNSLPTGAIASKHDDDLLLKTLTARTEAEQTTPRATRLDTIAFAEVALASGQTLDALLALLEYGLQSGDQLPDVIRKHRDKFGADAACQAYMKAFDQSSKAACEQSLVINASIDRTTLKRAHMLDLQRANHLERLGKTGEALAAYLKVIQANPFHAGALHDLGMLLARTYEHPKAWLCWDAARRLYPAHPMLKDIPAREIKLRATYPDFF